MCCRRLSQKVVKPRLRRELAEWAQVAHQMSQRRVAGLIPVERGTLRYQHHRDRQEALRVRWRELAGSRVRYGYRRLTVLLRREGWQVNAKRIYRLYTEEGLIVRTKRRKERAQRQRIAAGLDTRRNGRWSMDFVAQRLADGRWIRVLTVVDQFTRECLCVSACRHSAERREGRRGARRDRGGTRSAALDHRGQRTNSGRKALEKKRSLRKKRAESRQCDPCKQLCPQKRVRRYSQPRSSALRSSNSTGTAVSPTILET